MANKFFIECGLNHSTSTTLHQDLNPIKNQDFPYSISQQTAYLENRFIGENDKFIVDITEITDILNKEGYLVKMDIEKAFDLLDYTFVISVLEKFAFGNNFVSWIETLITRQESCVISNGNTTQYIHLE